MSQKAKEIANEMACNCLVARTRYLSRCMTAIYDSAYADYGISANQASILAALVSMGESSSGDLAEFFKMEKSTLSRNIERMKRQGWIEAQRAGRAQILKPTRDGRALLKKTYPAWLEAQSQSKELLGQSDANSLRSIVNKLWKMG